MTNIILFVVVLCLFFTVFFSYIILEKLPTEYDSRVKAMEVDEKPQEEYQDIGGTYKNPKIKCSNSVHYTSCNYR